MSPLYSFPLNKGGHRLCYLKIKYYAFSPCISLTNIYYLSTYFVILKKVSDCIKPNSALWFKKKKVVCRGCIIGIGFKGFMSPDYF